MTFRIAPGTPCGVRRKGEVGWTNHHTTHALTFTDYRAESNGGWWVFELDGWELRVHPSGVTRSGPKGRAARFRSEGETG